MLHEFGYVTPNEKAINSSLYIAYMKASSISTSPDKGLDCSAKILNYW